jgi:hypothetical protein
MTAPETNTRRVGRYVKLGSLLVTVYLVVALALLGYVRVKYLRMEPGEVEPDPAAADLPEDELPRLEAGRYGPEHPTPYNELQGVYFPTTINRLGARNRFEVGRDMDRETVVLIGDSFTFGVGLPDEQTLSHQLGVLDPKRAYINLGFPGFNLQNTVTRLLNRTGRMPEPRLVVVQVLLLNDIAAEVQVEARLNEMARSDHRLILPPFGWLLTEEKLMQLGWADFWGRIQRDDMSRARFETFIKAPLDRLAGGLPRTRVVVVLFAECGRCTEEGASRMVAWLRGYCDGRRWPLFQASEETLGQAFNSRLSDGHPDGGLNRRLAAELQKVVLAELGRSR